MSFQSLFASVRKFTVSSVSCHFCVCCVLISALIVSLSCCIRVIVSCVGGSDLRCLRVCISCFLCGEKVRL